MSMPRWYHRLYAKAFGYFWLPCPVCGSHFGGHEIRNRITANVLDEEGKSWRVCPKAECNSIAISRNIDKWYKLGK